MRDKVFVSRPLPDALIATLVQHMDVQIWQGKSAPSREQLIDAVKDCNGLLCMLTEKIDQSVLDACPKLRVISSMSVGVDHIDVTALTAREIRLGHTPGVLVETTADLAFSLLLAAARRIPEADRFVRDGHWESQNRWAPDMFLGKDVAGSTLGIIGLGQIGQAVARRAAGFNMRVLSWTRSSRQVPGIEAVEFGQLLKASDFVSVHVALTDQTRNLIDRAAIKKMKPGAVLINTARGGIVDELSLAQALLEGRLFAAGLDVFSEEPVQTDNPLLDLPNVVLAPHVGSASEDTRNKMAEIAVENLRLGLASQPMLHSVNFGPFA